MEATRDLGLFFLDATALKDKIKHTAEKSIETLMDIVPELIKERAILCSNEIIGEYE